MIIINKNKEKIGFSLQTVFVLSDCLSEIVLNLTYQDLKRRKNTLNNHFIFQPYIILHLSNMKLNFLTE